MDLQEIAKIVKGSPSTLRLRQCVIDHANADGTVALTVGGDSTVVDKVLAFTSCPRSAGDVVWCVTDGRDLFAIGKLGEYSSGGTNGADGKTVRSSSGVPSAALGVDGDWCIDRTNWLIYGPKANGSWGSGSSLVGPQGNPGTAATVAVGTVTTGAAGSSAQVTNSGTSQAAVFNFVIPRGDSGAKGDKGDPGANGLGVPAGGTTGQVLKKASDADNDTVWSPGGGGITLLDVYPVGSIYFSTNNTNPGGLFGGTWVAWGSGRVPVGVDAGQAEFDTVEETGGHKALQSHVHTIDPPNTTSGTQSADHTHGFTDAFERKLLKSGTTAWGNWGWNATAAGTTTGMSVSHTHDVNIPAFDSGSTGAGNAGNLPPYITCYMWKRTA